MAINSRGWRLVRRVRQGHRPHTYQHGTLYKSWDRRLGLSCSWQLLGVMISQVIGGIVVTVDLLLVITPLLVDHSTQFSDLMKAAVHQVLPELLFPVGPVRREQIDTHPRLTGLGLTWSVSMIKTPTIYLCTASGVLGSEMLFRDSSFTSLASFMRASTLYCSVTMFSNQTLLVHCAPGFGEQLIHQLF